MLDSQLMTEKWSLLLSHTKLKLVTNRSLLAPFESAVIYKILLTTSIIATGSLGKIIYLNMMDQWPSREEMPHRSDTDRRLSRTWIGQLICTEDLQGNVWTMIVAPTMRDLTDCAQQVDARTNPNVLIEGHRMNLILKSEALPESEFKELVVIFMQEHIVPLFVKFYQDDNEPTCGRVMENINTSFHGSHTLPMNGLLNHVYNFSVTFMIKANLKNAMEPIRLTAMAMLKQNVMLWSSVLTWKKPCPQDDYQQFELRAYPLHMLVDSKSPQIKVAWNRRVVLGPEVRAETLGRQFCNLFISSGALDIIKSNVRSMAPIEIIDQFCSVSFMDQCEYDGSIRFAFLTKICVCEKESV